MATATGERTSVRGSEHSGSRDQMSSRWGGGPLRLRGQRGRRPVRVPSSRAWISRAPAKNIVMCRVGSARHRAWDPPGRRRQPVSHHPNSALLVSERGASRPVAFPVVSEGNRRACLVCVSAQLAHESQARAGQAGYMQSHGDWFAYVCTLARKRSCLVA
jgi:hypothetical protein